MKTTQQLQEDINKAQLNVLEKALDKMFKDVDVDIEFTRHFLDRVNDKRNGKDITLEELKKLYVQTYKLHGKKFKNMGDKTEAMLKDFNSNINIPFVLKYDKKNDEFDLIAKTVMRKKNFLTRTKTLKVY